MDIKKKFLEMETIEDSKSGLIFSLASKLRTFLVSFDWIKSIYKERCAVSYRPKSELIFLIFLVSRSRRITLVFCTSTAGTRF